VNRVNYHSVDDVSILANPMNESLKVITTQEAIDYHVSVEEKASKQRVVTFNCTTVSLVMIFDRDMQSLLIVHLNYSQEMPHYWL
jgi:nitrous oxide reductase